MISTHKIYTPMVNGLFFFFFCKIQKKTFWGCFWNYPQSEIFSQKSGSVSFLPLRHPNFLRNFRKILWAVLTKTGSPTDTLTLMWWNHRTPFRLKAGSKKSNCTKFKTHIEELSINLFFESGTVRFAWSRLQTR